MRNPGRNGMNLVAKKLYNVMRIEVLLGIGLVLWVFTLELRAENYTLLKHPELSPDVKIIACEPVKYGNKDAPTFFWYALDINNSQGWQMTQETYTWSDAYEMEKTPNYLILKKRFQRIAINRKTLHTGHSVGDSACELSSVEAINQKAAEDASTNTI